MSNWLNKCGLNWRWWVTLPVILGVFLPVALLNTVVSAVADAANWLRFRVRWYIDTPLARVMRPMMRWAMQGRPTP